MNPEASYRYTQACILVAARMSGFSVEELTGASRRRRLVWWRQAAMVAARAAEMSYPEIARAFGGRDHTTAMHACSKVAASAAHVELASTIEEEAQAYLAGWSQPALPGLRVVS